MKLKINKPIREWTVDVDRFLNPFVPPPPRNHLPRVVLHFLGYRGTTEPGEQQQQQPEKTRAARGAGPDEPPPPPAPPPPPPLGNILVAAWAFLGTLASLSLVYVLGQSVPLFREAASSNSDGDDDRMPLILGSFGAAAVLEFHALASPLAQPRNAIIGHLLASVVGVALSSSASASASSADPQNNNRWFAGALATALALALMTLTDTVHPPAGATALLAVTDPAVARLRWALVPLVLLGAAAVLAVACLVNNCQRRFPLYWWTPRHVGGAWRRILGRRRRRRPGGDDGCGGREEEGRAGRSSEEGKEKEDGEESGAVVDEEEDQEQHCHRQGGGKQGEEENNQEKAATAQGDAGEVQEKTNPKAVTISERGVVVPIGLHLSPEERVLLDALVRRLRS